MSVIFLVDFLIKRQVRELLISDKPPDFRFFAARAKVRLKPEEAAAT
jgi:hypothetical protein